MTMMTREVTNDQLDAIVATFATTDATPTTTTTTTPATTTFWRTLSRSSQRQQHQRPSCLKPVSSSSSSSSNDDYDSPASKRLRRTTRRIHFGLPLHSSSSSLSLSSFVSRCVQVFVDPREAPVQPLWYTPDELRTMKQQAKLSCRQQSLREQQQQQLQLLLQQQLERRGGGEDESFHTITTTTPSLESVLSDVYWHCCEDTTDGASASDGISRQSSPSGKTTGSTTFSWQHVWQQRLLQHHPFQQQRGMERWSSHRQALSRGVTILQVKTEVFLAQEEAAATAAAEATVSCRSLHLSSSSLAAVCAAASQPAVRFARFLGELDALVVAAAQQQE